MSPGLYLLLISLIGAAGGLFLGQSRNRTITGLVLGALLGPMGWIVIALGPDRRRKCVYCHGALRTNETRCEKCGYDVQDRDYDSEVTPFVYCPACGAQNRATAQERSDGMLCSTCQARFVPAADVRQGRK